MSCEMLKRWLCDKLEIGSSITIILLFITSSLLSFPLHNCKKYKKLYESADPNVKESIKARAEFVMLDTPERIENFWQCSGLDKTNILTESFVTVPNATNLNELDGMDRMIASIGEVMKDKFPLK